MQLLQLVMTGKPLGCEFNFSKDTVTIFAKYLRMYILRLWLPIPRVATTTCISKTATNANLNLTQKFYWSVVGQKPPLIEKENRMAQLPEFVVNAREEANAAADAHHDALEKLQAIGEPSYEDVEK